MIASGGLALVTASLAVPLREPPREHRERTFLAMGSSALARVWRRPALRWSIAVVALAQLTVEMIFVVSQPALVAAGAPVWSLGAFSGAILLGSSAGGWVAGAVVRQVGFARSLGIPAPLATLAPSVQPPSASGSSLMLLAPFGWNVLIRCSRTTSRGASPTTSGRRHRRSRRPAEVGA
ncbi:MAG: hypothetical protein U0360_08510 [Dehalococcoidia bacterium]